MTSIPASAVDGRSLRRERNRQDIVDALLGLIENGETEISAALIASKAGLSERSIFRYFDDVNDLYRSVCDQAFSKEIEYALIDDVGVGSLDTKIENFVNQRVRIYTMNEKIAPAARSFAKNPSTRNGSTDFSLPSWPFAKVPRQTSAKFKSNHKTIEAL